MSNENILLYLTFLKSLNQRDYQTRQYEVRLKNISYQYCDQGDLIAVLMERYSQLGDEMIFVDIKKNGIKNRKRFSRT